jgi:hypothetical protein
MTSPSLAALSVITGRLSRLACDEPFAALVG